MRVAVIMDFFLRVIEAANYYGAVIANSIYAQCVTTEHSMQAAQICYVIVTSA